MALKVISEGVFFLNPADVSLQNDKQEKVIGGVLQSTHTPVNGRGAAATTAVRKNSQETSEEEGAGTEINKHFL